MTPTGGGMIMFKLWGEARELERKARVRLPDISAKKPHWRIEVSEKLVTAVWRKVDGSMKFEAQHPSDNLQNSMKTAMEMALRWKKSRPAPVVFYLWPIRQNIGEQNLGSGEKYPHREALQAALEINPGQFSLKSGMFWTQIESGGGAKSVLVSFEAREIFDFTTQHGGAVRWGPHACILAEIEKATSEMNATYCFIDGRQAYYFYVKHGRVQNMRAHPVSNLNKELMAGAEIFRQPPRTPFLIIPLVELSGPCLEILEGAAEKAKVLKSETLEAEYPVPPALAGSYRNGLFPLALFEGPGSRME